MTEEEKQKLNPKGSFARRLWPFGDQEHESTPMGRKVCLQHLAAHQGISHSSQPPELACQNPLLQSCPPTCHPQGDRVASSTYPHLCFWPQVQFSPLDLLLWSKVSSRPWLQDPLCFFHLLQPEIRMKQPVQESPNIKENVWDLYHGFSSKTN